MEHQGSARLIAQPGVAAEGGLAGFLQRFGGKDGKESAFDHGAAGDGLERSLAGWGESHAPTLIDQEARDRKLARKGRLRPLIEIPAALLARSDIGSS